MADPVGRHGVVALASQQTQRVPGRGKKHQPWALELGAFVGPGRDFRQVWHFGRVLNLLSGSFAAQRVPA
eukprot:365339-Chlamydomonas_euryale.AAC.13